MIKANLIEGDKAIKALILSLLWIFSCKSQELHAQNTKLMYEITFANGFLNDRVSVVVNNKEVVKSLKLVSDKSDGVTSLSAKVFKGKDGFVISTTTSGKLIAIKSNTDIVTLKVLYKGKWHAFTPNQSHGRYILVEADKGLHFIQQERKPVFD